MLDEYLAFFLSKSCSEFVFVGLFLVYVANLGLSARLLEQVMVRLFVPSENHVKGWSNFSEWDSFHLDGSFVHIFTLEVPEFNRLEVTSACE